MALKRRALPLTRRAPHTRRYGKKFARALDGSFAEAATRCGVNIVSGDYWQSSQMEGFVWAFDRTVDLTRTDKACFALLSHGRWALRVRCRGPRRADFFSFCMERLSGLTLDAQLLALIQDCDDPKEVRHMACMGATELDWTLSAATGELRRRDPLSRALAAPHRVVLEQPMSLHHISPCTRSASLPGTYADMLKACPRGFAPGVPPNGLANARLVSIALTRPVWIPLDFPIAYSSTRMA